MENNEERASAMNIDKLNPAAAGAEQARNPNCSNADNHDLGPLEVLPSATFLR
jgi:hypothetical protein